MEIKTTWLSAFDGLELKEASFRNRIFPEHFHDSYSIGIIERGVERLSFGTKEVLAHASTVTIVNPYDIHANRFFDNDEWKYRAFYVSIDAMQHMQSITGLFKGKNIWFPQQLIDDRYLYQLMLNFHESKDVKDIGGILTYIIHQYAEPRPSRESVNEGITDASHYLTEHFAEKFNIASIAARYGMDKYKFIRLFKKQIGLTPVSYALLHRINKAKTLISADVPITSVALETGFYDQAHFIHCFKKYQGVAPLAYKRGLEHLS